MTIDPLLHRKAPLFHTAFSQPTGQENGNYIFIGAAIFGKKVWAIEFEDAWKSWLAIVLGEISFLYSFVFVVAGIWIICAYFRNREDNDWGLKCGLH